MQTQRDRQAEREAVYYDEAVRARDISEGELLIGPCAPLSHVGGLLAGLLRSSPQHCMAAVVQQMEKLEQDKIQASEQAPKLAHLPLKDKLLEELRVRKTQLEQDAQSQERTNTILDLLYVCVVMCFQDLGVDMTPNLRHSHLMQTTAFEPQETHALMQMHGEEAAALVQKYLSKVTHQAEPIAVGSYQMRMPPMVPNAAIAIPHVFLVQMYSDSIKFGYSLRRAQQIQELEHTLEDDRKCIHNKNTSRGATLGQEHRVVVSNPSNNVAPAASPSSPSKPAIPQEVSINNPSNASNETDQGSKIDDSAKSQLDSDLQRNLAAAFGPGWASSSGAAAEAGWIDEDVRLGARRMDMETMPIHSGSLPLSEFMRRHQAVRTPEARMVCKHHTAALFGEYKHLFLSMEACLRQAASVEEAQDKLDEAMRSNDVAWLNMSVSGIERLVLEAITFGRVLWDVERTFDIEYSLVSE